MLLHFRVHTFLPVFMALIHLENAGSVGLFVIAKVARDFVANSVLCLLMGFNLKTF